MFTVQIPFPLYTLCDNTVRQSYHIDTKLYEKNSNIRCTLLSLCTKISGKYPFENWILVKLEFGIRYHQNNVCVFLSVPIFNQLRLCTKLMRPSTLKSRSIVHSSLIRVVFFHCFSLLSAVCWRLHYVASSQQNPRSKIPHQRRPLIWAAIWAAHRSKTKRTSARQSVPVFRLWDLEVPLHRRVPSVRGEWWTHNCFQWILTRWRNLHLKMNSANNHLMDENRELK